MLRLVEDDTAALRRIASGGRGKMCPMDLGVVKDGENLTVGG